MSSSSKSSQATSQTDNRRVLGQDAISAENSSVNVWNSTLDADIVNRALSSVDGVTGDAFGFGKSALSFGSDALGLADSVAGRAITANTNAYSDSLGFAEGLSKAKDTIISNVFSDALASNDSAVKQVLTYGSNASNKAYDSLAATSNLVKDAYADAKGRGALTDKILMGSIAAMAVVAFMAVKK
jgi:hypothetical protein